MKKITADIGSSAKIGGWTGTQWSYIWHAVSVFEGIIAAISIPK